MPIAVARYSSGRIADDVMFSRNGSHKNPFTVPLSTLARYKLSSCVCLSVCLSVCHKPVCIETTKRIKLV